MYSKHDTISPANQARDEAKELDGIAKTLLGYDHEEAAVLALPAFDSAEPILCARRMQIV